jgi:hypothetical protein
MFTKVVSHSLAIATMSVHNQECSMTFDIFILYIENVICNHSGVQSDWAYKIAS